MKRNYVRMFVVFLFAASFTVAAKGQEPDRLAVKVPFNFVVNGTTLPAGAYQVSRFSENDLFGLAITNVETGSTVMALSSDVERVSSNQPKITLERAGDQRFLSKIQTAAHVFTIPVSAPALAEAAAKANPGSYMTVTPESGKR